MSESGAHTCVRALAAGLLEEQRDLYDGFGWHAGAGGAGTCVPPHARNSVVPFILNTGPWLDVAGTRPISFPCRPDTDGIRAKSRPLRASSAFRALHGRKGRESPGTTGTVILLWAESLPNKGLRYCYEVKGSKSGAAAAASLPAWFSRDFS